MNELLSNKATNHSKQDSSMTYPTSICCLKFFRSTLHTILATSKQLIFHCSKIKNIEVQEACYKDLACHWMRDLSCCMLIINFNQAQT